MNNPNKIDLIEGGGVEEKKKILLLVKCHGDLGFGLV